MLNVEVSGADQVALGQRLTPSLCSNFNSLRDTDSIEYICAYVGSHYWRSLDMSQSTPLILGT